MNEQEANIFSIFPPEKARKFEAYRDILSILADLSEDQVDSAFSSLKPFFNNEIYLTFIIRKIILFCEIFPVRIDLYTRLAKQISLNVPNFSEQFLSNSFHRFYFFIDCSEGYFTMYMFYRCIKNELFTFDELLSRFKTSFRQKYNYDNNILFFIYFSPEIKENDPTFYEEISNYVERESNFTASESLHDFYFNKFKENLVKNDFQMLKKFREDGHISENPLFEIIFNDDVDKLREFLSNPNKSGNEIVVHSIISPYCEIANNLSLISTAAVFSAVKCFKYLLQSGSRTDEVSKENGSLAQDTIVGGNVEIIRFAQQNRVDFEGVLSTCANYFKNEIFDWIFETNGNNPEELIKQSPTGSTVFCQACRIGNMEIVLKCIEFGISLNSYDIDSSPISQAVLGGNDEIVDLLLSFGEYQALHQPNFSQKLEEKTVKNEEEEEAFIDDEYEYDYDNFDFDDALFPVIEIMKKENYGVKQIINFKNIYHSMRCAASQGQKECLEKFVDHGFIIDISLIVRAILYSRYSTLDFLLNAIDIETEKNEILVTFHSRYRNKKEEDNDDLGHKWKFLFNRSVLIAYFIKFMLKQNNVNIVKLIFKKLNFDINDINDNNFLITIISQFDYFPVELVDTAGFIITNLTDENKIKILEKIRKDYFIIFMQSSIYKTEIKDFLIEYEKKNEGKELPNKIKELTEAVKSII